MSMVTDSIADMLTRIRNALTARHAFTDMPASKMKVSLAQTLKQEGFIRDFEVLEEGVKRTVRIHLAYTDRRGPTITGVHGGGEPGGGGVRGGGGRPARLRRPGRRHRLYVAGAAHRSRSAAARARRGSGLLSVGGTADVPRRERGDNDS